MQLPVLIGDYTDFYSSKEHATNVGKMFRDPSLYYQLASHTCRIPRQKFTIVPSGIRYRLWDKHYQMETTPCLDLHV
jgi:fumarylacetoacetase